MLLLTGYNIQQSYKFMIIIYAHKLLFRENQYFDRYSLIDGIQTIYALQVGYLSFSEQQWAVSSISNY